MKSSTEFPAAIAIVLPPAVEIEFAVRQFIGSFSATTPPMLIPFASPLAKVIAWGRTPKCSIQK